MFMHRASMNSRRVHDHASSSSARRASAIHRRSVRSQPTSVSGSIRGSGIVACPLLAADGALGISNPLAVALDEGAVLPGVAVFGAVAAQTVVLGEDRMVSHRSCRLYGPAGIEQRFISALRHSHRPLPRSPG
jgi:hypothetical protein